MNSDSRGLVAIVLSILVFILWYSYISPKYFPKPVAVNVPAEVAKTEATPPQTESAKEATTAIHEKEIAEKRSILETDDYVAEFSNYGAAPIKWSLKQYTVGDEGKGGPVDLVPVKVLKKEPLILSFQKFPLPEKAKFEVVEEGKNILRYRWSGNGLLIEKTYKTGEHKYDITMDVEVKNLSGQTLTDKISLGWSAAVDTKSSGGFLSFLKSPSNVKVPVYLMNGKVTRETSPTDIKTEEVKYGAVSWTGIEDRYFLAAILPRAVGTELGLEQSSFGEGADRGFYTGIVLPEFNLAPSSSEKYTFSVYAGPKEMDDLKAMGVDMDKAIDYGWFTVIAIPILYVLKFLYGVVHNYGIAIILLTILVKLLLHPISKKSMKSMKGMQQLQPRLKELREKYKHDKERLNVEMMQLFKIHKVNPMSGCLPMLLQFPIYIALYRVLWNSIELYHAPFFWFYKDLSQPDPYFITPVILGVAMFLQQKLTPMATADPAQQKMMMFMPIMFSVFLIFLPVGLVVYILVNTVMTVAQQWMTNNDVRLRDLVRGRFLKRAKA